MMIAIIIVLSVTIVHSEIGVSNAVAVEEKWGYVNVRKDAFMFWWLFYADQEDYSDTPLILWIQGGPGASGTGLGNILEIGPFDVNSQPRNSTWLTRANLLFLDSPVGTGYSYVTDKSALVRSDAETTKDLLIVLHSIFLEIPELQKSPLHIFSESYGGKVAVDFALALESAIKSNTIQCDFKGISLGDSWISPADQVASLGNYFYGMSLLDDSELATVNNLSDQILMSLDKKLYMDAEEQYSQFSDLIDTYTNNGDWYNVLKNEGPHNSGCFRGRSIEDSVYDKLGELMNGPMRQKLRIIPDNVIWSYESDDVYEALKGDNMKGVLSSVDDLLINHSHLDINVYNGQLDPIINILGVLNWIKRLNWPGLSAFQASPKQPIMFPGNRTGGFSKSYQQFSLFWIMDAGHFVPYDAPEASLKMLDIILANK